MFEWIANPIDTALQRLHSILTYAALAVGGAVLLAVLICCGLKCRKNPYYRDLNPEDIEE